MTARLMPFVRFFKPIFLLYFYSATDKKSCPSQSRLLYNTPLQETTAKPFRRNIQNGFRQIMPFA
jgi:hypothetical protein